MSYGRCYAKRVRILIFQAVGDRLQNLRFLAAATAAERLARLSLQEEYMPNTWVQRWKGCPF